MGWGDAGGFLCESCRAMAIASEAGPNPMQRRSRSSSGDELGEDEIWPLACPFDRCPLVEKVRCITSNCPLSAGIPFVPGSGIS